MVDAINNIKQPVQPVKDVSVDWKSCTADEIIDYKGQGQEVPTEYLRWAQEMAKISGAPDDVTYEMSISNSELSPANAGGANASVAQGLKNGLEANQTDLMTQGQIFSGASAQYTNEISTLEGQMEGILTKSEDAAKKAQEFKDNLISQIQTLQAKQQQVKNDKTGMFSAFEALNIENQIKELASAGFENINNIGQDVYTETNGIDAAQYTAQTGSDIGTQTIDVGNQLRGILDMHSQGIAQQIVNTGNSAVTKASEGETKFNNTESDNTENIKTVNDAKLEVTQKTQTAPGASDTNENTTETKETSVTDSKTAQEKNQPDNNTNQNLSDASFTTDPNEILKRKERRGIV